MDIVQLAPRMAQHAACTILGADAAPGGAVLRVNASYPV